MGMSTNIGFKWTDELVAEYSLASQSLTLWEFKRKKMAELESVPQWEIVQVSSQACGLYYLNGYKMRSTDKIYSVKRLSDGEIFSLGDVIYFANEPSPISGFELDNVDTTNIRATNGFQGRGIKGWRKHKKILFKTEDGVHVYEDDQIALLYLDTWLISYPHKAHGSPFKGDENQFKYFSNKETAEEYIIMNKPLFSISEIASKIINHSFYKDNYIELLTQKAKKKLNPDE